MDYNLYEDMIINLCGNGQFDKAEEEKKKIIPLLKRLLKQNDPAGKRILELFSQLAGEAESFKNFSDLLDELMEEDLVTKSNAERLIMDSPAGRWL